MTALRKPKCRRRRDELDDAQRGALLAVLSDALHEADHAQVRSQGRGSMRRLNRGEYEENLRDLLHLPHLDVRDILPEDREAHHSNKSAETLEITRVQLDAYLDAADVALRQAVAGGIELRTPSRYHALATKHVSQGDRPRRKGIDVLRKELEDDSAHVR